MEVNNELTPNWFLLLLALGALFIAGITLARHYGLA